jgi:hypothetical protein
MPCTEITNAIAWNKQSTGKKDFPVKAYFTTHFGYGEPYKDSRDAVHYASGNVVAVDQPSPHLAGTLKGAKNNDQDGEMAPDAKLTYYVEIFPDGKLSYLMKLNGHPVGGMPATTVQATCVDNVLLTATQGSEVVAVGVSRQPEVGIPW